MAGEDTSATLTNRDRLLQHLKEDSLAARLVRAQSNAADLKAVLKERLDQVRHDLDGDSN